MKKYIKPTLDFVELRTEERLATCSFVMVKCAGVSGNQQNKYK